MTEKIADLTVISPLKHSWVFCNCRRKTVL